MSAGRNRTWLLVAVLAALSSSGMAQNIALRRFSLPAATLLALVATVAAGAAFWVVVTGLERTLERVDVRSASSFAWIAILGLVLVQSAGYALELLNSERDDIQYGAVRTLLDGRNPYDFVIPWGAANSAFPTMLLLETPLVLLRALHLGHLAVLAALLLAARIESRTARPFLVFLAGVFVMPVFIRQSFPEGAEMALGDLGVVLAFALAPVIARSRLGRGLPLALLVGLLLCAKANYLLAVPALLAIMLASASAARATAYVAMMLVVGIAASVPFYLWAPSTFSPLGTSEFLTAFDSTLPQTSTAVLVAWVALGGWVIARARTPSTCYWGGALLLAIPVLPVFLVPVIGGGAPALQWWPTYLMPAAFLALWGTAGEPGPSASKVFKTSAGPGIRRALGAAFGALGIAGIALMTLVRSVPENSELMRGIADGAPVESIAAALPEGLDGEALPVRDERWNGGRLALESPLVLAARVNRPDVVALLVERGLSPDSGRNAYALCAALYYGYERVAEELIASGAPDDVWCGKWRARSRIGATQDPR